MTARILFASFTIVGAVAVATGAQERDPAAARRTPILTVRPSALAQMVGEIAGYEVTVPGARILWVVDDHAMVVESDSRVFKPTWRDRSRILVVIGNARSLAIPRPPVETAPVNIAGVARTLLGLQAAHDVPWPRAITRDVIDDLDIRAAVLASSIRTPDGVELTRTSDSNP